MKRLSGCEYVELPRRHVFEAGIQKCTWPKGLNGLEVEPDDDCLALGGLVRIGVTVASFKEVIESQVTKLDSAERIEIKGQSRRAEVAVGLALTDTDTGTQVAYDINMSIKGVTGHMFEPIVYRFLQSTAPEFIAQYKNNVVAYHQSVANAVS